LIGREGMMGLPIVLGNHRSPHATYIQVPGKGRLILDYILDHRRRATLGFQPSVAGGVNLLRLVSDILV
jgi:hypothetical protein